MGCTQSPQRDNEGSHRSEFTFDSNGRRVKVVEKENGAVTGGTLMIWYGAALLQERSLAGAPSRSWFSGGFQQESGSHFWVGDQLGSMREVTDTEGTTRARYDYDPYGRGTRISDDVDAPPSFAGLLDHPASGLMLATYCAYDSGLGRWLSQDPIGLTEASTYTRSSRRSCEPRGSPRAFPRRRS